MIIIYYCVIIFTFCAIICRRTLLTITDIIWTFFKNYFAINCIWKISSCIYILTRFITIFIFEKIIICFTWTTFSRRTLSTIIIIIWTFFINCFSSNFSRKIFIYIYIFTRYTIIIFDKIIICFTWSTFSRWTLSTIRKIIWAFFINCFSSICSRKIFS